MRVIMKQYRTIVLTLALTAAAALLLTGCETTKGIGRDMENLGEGIQKTAE